MSESDKETTNETAGQANYPNVTLDQEGIAFERTKQLRRQCYQEDKGVNRIEIELARRE